jgi:hypothetical protein
MNVAKTEETQKLERDIGIATKKMGVFGCYEVTIGWFGDERVDYMTYDTKGTFRCYEIKVSKPDFYSKSKKTFVGHFNYFVLTNALYEEVKHDIPNHIGVYVGQSCVKRPKRQELLVDEKVLKDSLIRSLSRDVEKLLKSHDPNYVNRMNRLFEQERRVKEQYQKRLNDIQNMLFRKFGPRWQREIEEPELPQAIESTEIA